MTHKNRTHKFSRNNLLSCMETSGCYKDLAKPGHKKQPLIGVNTNPNKR